MLRLYCLGPISLVSPDTTVHEDELPGRHGRVLLAALITARGPIPNDALAERIWPRDMPADWPKSLAPLVSRTRRKLEAVDRTGTATVRVANGCHELVLPSAVWIDVEDAVRRLDRAEGSLRRGDHDAAWTDAAPASAVLRRSFLPGFDAPWADEVRADLSDRRYRVWAVLSQAWEASGDHTMAARAAEEAIGVDPYREEAYRLLMVAELAAGNRGRAVQAAQRCRTLLREDLGVDPSPETIDLERRALGPGA